MNKLKKRYPLSFIIVGRDDEQDADDLLEVIKLKLESSSYAIFDGTRGNANVSLEYGFAEAREIPRALYLSTHGRVGGTTESPIIADLAGKRRNHYTQERGLQKLLEGFSKTHAYTIRFERFLRDSFGRRSSGAKRRLRALSLKILHSLDNQHDRRRADIVDSLLADHSRYTRDEIDDMILRMHRSGLIQSVQGPHSRITVT